MKKAICTILAVFLLSITIPGYSLAEDQPDVAAIGAAENFTETLDKADFSAAWQQTSEVNQSYGNQRPDWFVKLVAVRPHLGKVTSRALEKLSRHASWVGLPDGDYLRVSFTTTFSNKADSLETVVLVKQQGHWVVSSYHLR